MSKFEVVHVPCTTLYRKGLSSSHHSSESSHHSEKFRRFDWPKQSLAATLQFGSLVFWAFWHFGILAHFGFWHFGAFWHFGFGQFGILARGILAFWHFGILGILGGNGASRGNLSRQPGLSRFYGNQSGSTRQIEGNPTLVSFRSRHDLVKF